MYLVFVKAYIGRVTPATVQIGARRRLDAAWLLIRASRLIDSHPHVSDQPDITCAVAVLVQAKKRVPGSQGSQTLSDLRFVYVAVERGILAVPLPQGLK